MDVKLEVESDAMIESDDGDAILLRLGSHAAADLPHQLRQRRHRPTELLLAQTSWNGSRRVEEKGGGGGGGGRYRD